MSAARREPRVLLALVAVAFIASGILYLVLAVPASRALEAAPDLTRPEAVRGWLQSALAAPQGPPSISVAVSLGGEIVLAEAAGFADLAGDKPATPDTTYRVYSISKGITAVAVMQLLEKGRVDLADDVRRYVPRFPEKRWPVRLVHLLSHTSGIRHYKPDAGEISSTTEYPSLGDSLAVFAADPLAFEPGTDTLYTSFGFNLLTGVVESAAAVSFEEYLEARVFAPAGMESSGLAVAGREMPGLASPYWRPRQEGQPNWPIDELPNVSGRYGSSGLIATPSDLVRLFDALGAGRLLEPETVALMLSAPFPDLDPEQAHGWNLERKDGVTAVYRGGAGTGYTGGLVHYPEHGLTVALLANQNQFEERWRLLDELAAAFLAKRLP